MRLGLQPNQRSRHDMYDFMGWQLSKGQAVAAGLIAANVTVHLMWMAARGRSNFAARIGAFLQRNFLHYPFSGRAFPLGALVCVCVCVCVYVCMYVCVYVCVCAYAGYVCMCVH